MISNFSSEITLSFILTAFPFISLLISLLEFSSLDNKTRSTIFIFSSIFLEWILTFGKFAPREFPEKASFAACSEFLAASLPTVDIQSKKIEEKIDIVELVLLSKLETSKSEIRRLIKGNAIKINDNIVSDEKFEINKNLFKHNYLKLSLGKKRHIKIELN